MRNDSILHLVLLVICTWQEKKKKKVPICDIWQDNEVTMKKKEKRTKESQI